MHKRKILGTKRHFQLLFFWLNKLLIKKQSSYHIWLLSKLKLYDAHAKKKQTIRFNFVVYKGPGKIIWENSQWFMSFLLNSNWENEQRTMNETDGRENNVDLISGVAGKMGCVEFFPRKFHISLSGRIQTIFITCDNTLCPQSTPHDPQVWPVVAPKRVGGEKIAERKHQHLSSLLFAQNY